MSRMFIDGARREVLPSPRPPTCTQCGHGITFVLKITGLLDCRPYLPARDGVVVGASGAKRVTVLRFLLMKGRRRWRGGQSGCRRAKRPCVVPSAIYLMGTRRRMSAAVSVLPKSTPTYSAYIAVRAINALPMIWVMQLIVYQGVIMPGFIRRGSLPYYRARTCLRQKTGASRCSAREWQNYCRRR